MTSYIGAGMRVELYIGREIYSSRQCDETEESSSSHQDTFVLMTGHRQYPEHMQYARGNAASGGYCYSRAVDACVIDIIELH